MSPQTPDPRLNAYRPDLAAAVLEGVVDAARYVQGETRQVVEPTAPVRREPRFDAELDTEALHGETLTVFDEREGWSWVQLAQDGYVGYVPSDALGPVSRPATHRVTALRTYLFPAPDKKVPPLAQLSLNSKIALSEPETGEAGFTRLASGEFVYARHVVPLDHTEPDFVAVAERFVGTPYLWGGRTSLGIDCSALIQLALEAAGRSGPRDSDMQEAVLGDPLPDHRDLSVLERGDLIFWKGHMGVIVSGSDLLHANAHYMQTVVEPLSSAIERIASIHGAVTTIKRLGR